LYPRSELPYPDIGNPDIVPDIVPDIGDEISDIRASSGIARENIPGICQAYAIYMPIGVICQEYICLANVWKIINK
jgi:hypothetical protein